MHINIHVITPYRLDRRRDDHVATAGPGHRTLDQKQITFGIHANHFEILGGALARYPCARPFSYP